MKIQIISKNKEYGFNIVSDNGKSLFCSPIHYFLATDIKPSYKYAWKAYSDARKLISKRYYHLAQTEITNYDSSTTESPMTTTQLTDVSTETMIVDHYMNVLDALKLKAKQSKSSKQDRPKVYNEIKMIKKELEAIGEKLTDKKDKLKIKRVLGKYKKLMMKYFRQEYAKDEAEERKEKEQQKTTGEIAQAIPPDQPQPQAPMPNPFDPSTPMPQASSNLMSKIAVIMDPESEKGPDFKEELMDEYADRICESIQDKHPNSYCHYDSPEKDQLIVYDGTKPILKAKINKYLLVSNIIPVGELAQKCPIQSDLFYHKYWKPIVQNLSHFSTTNPPVLVIADETNLPDVGEDNILKGWNIKEGKFDSVNIGFSDGSWNISPPKSLVVRKSSSNFVSQYVEDDFQNAIVKCVDAKLESIFDRTGEVMQVIPGTDFLELDVNFGEGLDVVRLTDKQVQKVDLSNIDKNNG